MSLDPAFFGLRRADVERSEVAAIDELSAAGAFKPESIHNLRAGSKGALRQERASGIQNGGPMQRHTRAHDTAIWPAIPQVRHGIKFRDLIRRLNDSIRTSKGLRINVRSLGVEDHNDFARRV